MRDSRLPAGVEASGLIRRVEAQGDFAALLRKGDPDRGALLLVVGSRGRHVACLERVLSLSDGEYRWQTVGPGESAGAADGPYIGYLKALQSWDRTFPGFGHDTHGVEAHDGEYYVQCVLD